MKLPRTLSNEQAVLGAMLRDQHELLRVSYLLTAEMFTTDAHQKTYAALLDTGKADLVKVATLLWERKQVEDMGGYGYLLLLWDACPAPCQATWCAIQVKERWLRRELIHAGADLIRNGHQPYGPARDMAQDSVTRLKRLT